MSLVSIIVPVYNVELYIDECINSIIKQTYTHWQLILINDGSSDNSGAICKKYRDSDSRIIYIETKNRGVSCARNLGMENAVGEWILFVDSDDWIDIKTLEYLEVAAKNDVDICFFSLREIRKNKVIEILNPSKNKVIERQDFFQYQRWLYNQYLYKGNYSVSVPFCKLYRRKFLLKNNLEFIEGVKIGEDKVFNLYAFSCAYKGYYIERAMYNYRINSESAIRRYREDSVVQIEKMLLLMEQFIIDNGLHDRLISDYYVRLVMSVMYYVTLDFCHKDNPKKYNIRKDEYYKLVSYKKYSEAINRVSNTVFPFKQRVLFLAIKTKSFFLINLLCKSINK
ncbi:MAG: glycosyltransferase [Eubacteriales bacterium]